MKSFIKKSILIGLGVTALTKEKFEKVIKDLKKSGEINAKDGKELVKYFIRESEKKHKELKKIIDIHVEGAVKRAKLVTKKEIIEFKKSLKKTGKKVVKRAKKTIKKKIKKRRR